MSDGLGVSASDDYYPTPYAYVGPWTQRTGPFWNAHRRFLPTRQKGIVMAELNSDFSQYRRPLSGYRERDDRNSRRNSADRRAA
jgi:hypothetical protein